MVTYAVIPCYKSPAIAHQIVTDCLKYVDKVICVDDYCPMGTGQMIEEKVKSPNLIVLYHEKNFGVGGATKTGIRYAVKQNADVIVKIDSDGQMPSELIPKLIKPILKGNAEFTKGNRFRTPDVRAKMPFVRLVGNLGLSFLTKLSTGYWELFDPTNGFLAFDKDIIQRIPLNKLDNRYFFETDLLFRLSLAETVVEELPMQAKYSDENSDLLPFFEFFNFFLKHIFIFHKRILYQYFLLDFNPGSVSLIIASILGSISLLLGSIRLVIGHITGNETPVGIQTLFLALIIISSQFFMNFIYFDVSQRPLFRKLRLRTN